VEVQAGELKAKETEELRDRLSSAQLQSDAQAERLSAYEMETASLKSEVGCGARVDCCRTVIDCFLQECKFFFYCFVVTEQTAAGGVGGGEQGAGGIEGGGEGLEREGGAAG
jgi:hypothetical protein